MIAFKSFDGQGIIDAEISQHVVKGSIFHNYEDKMIDVCEGHNSLKLILLLRQYRGLAAKLAVAANKAAPK